MPKKCMVPGCRSGYLSDPFRSPEIAEWYPDLKVAILSFPKDEQVVRKWLQIIPRKGYKVTKHSSICSLHFYPEDLHMVSMDKDPSRIRKRGDKKILKKMTLHKGAMPKSFPFAGMEDLWFHQACKRHKEALEILESEPQELPRLRPKPEPEPIPEPEGTEVLDGPPDFFSKISFNTEIQEPDQNFEDEEEFTPDFFERFETEQKEIIKEVQQPNEIGNRLQLKPKAHRTSSSLTIRKAEKQFCDKCQDEITNRSSIGNHGSKLSVSLSDLSQVLKESKLPNNLKIIELDEEILVTEFDQQQQDLSMKYGIRIKKDLSYKLICQNFKIPRTHMIYTNSSSKVSSVKDLLDILIPLKNIHKNFNSSETVTTNKDKNIAKAVDTLENLVFGGNLGEVVSNKVEQVIQDLSQTL